jgi:bacteriorhodopsin
MSTTISITLKNYVQWFLLLPLLFGYILLEKQKKYFPLYKQLAK